MSISIAISSTASKVLYYLKKIFLFFKVNLSLILFLLLIISVTVNLLPLKSYIIDYEANKLVDEYKNNGLGLREIDCSNYETEQAHRAELLSYLILANSKYTSNPKKYVDIIEYTSGTEVLDCDNK